MLPKPKYTSKLELIENGAKWTVEAALGIQSIHIWTVKPISDQECSVTEQVTCNAPFAVFYTVKWQWPTSQANTHKNLQEYLS